MSLAKITLVTTLVFGTGACVTKSRCIDLTNPESLTSVNSTQTAPRQPQWGYRLSPIEPGTIDADGSIRVWHARTSGHSYPSENACMEAAQKGLDYLNGEAWNMEAECSTPPPGILMEVPIDLKITICED